MPVSVPLKWLVVLLLLGGFLLLALWPALPRLPIARQVRWARLSPVTQLVGMAACVAGVLSLLLVWPLMFWVFLGCAAAAALVTARAPAH